ncbi:phage terminase large subunit [Methanothermococcus sp. SCGC AD-155-C09]|nr:phage terminase large subunit [Methanothermococcus sp. SCGC AD-155-C09]
MATNTKLQRYSTQHITTKLKTDLEFFIEKILKEKLHHAQQKIIDAYKSKKYKTIIVAAGRRFGKSKLMAFLLIFLCSTQKNKKYAVIAPFYSNARIIFREIKKYIEKSNILSKLVKRMVESPYMTIEFKTGCTIDFRSADNPTSIRGESYHLVILDEAAFIKDNVVKYVIKPLLLDYDAPLIEISTPNGHNHFYESFLMGENKQNRHISFRFPTWANPFLPKSAIEEIKQEVGEDSPVWKQEYCAEFIDDNEAVFKWEYIQQCIDGTINLLKSGEKGHQYVMGVDLAKFDDYTVITILDVSVKPYKLVYFERFNLMPYSFVADKVKELYQLFNKPQVCMDATGPGAAVVEQVESLNPIGFTFTSKNKLPLITKLQTSIVKNEVLFPYLDQLITELKYFRYVKRKTQLSCEGKGQHDDCVMSLALAVYASESKQTQVINNYAYTLR